MRKTTKDRIRFFDRLADDVQDQSGAASRLAREIVEESHAELEAIHSNGTVYQPSLGQFIDQFVELGEHLEPVTTEESLEHYLRAVSNLQSAVEDDAPLLDRVDAHDEVCEAADSLDILLDVVPDE